MVLCRRPQLPFGLRCSYGCVHTAVPKTLVEDLSLDRRRRGGNEGAVFTANTSNISSQDYSTLLFTLKLRAKCACNDLGRASFTQGKLQMEEDAVMWHPGTLI